MSKHTTITVDARRYEGEDDCLAAAAADAAKEYGCPGYDMAPRWSDDSRESILLDVPAHAVAAE